MSLFWFGVVIGAVIVALPSWMHAWIAHRRVARLRAAMGGADGGYGPLRFDGTPITGDAIDRLLADIFADDRRKHHG